MTFESIKPYLPYVAYALPFVLGLISLLVSGKLKGFAHETVAAVYRSAIHAASELQDEGLLWLQSAEGIAYRLHVRANWNVRYGMQIDVLEARIASDDDAADGYDFFDLVDRPYAGTPVTIS